MSNENENENEIDPTKILAEDPVVARLFLAVVWEPYERVEDAVEKLWKVLGEEHRWNHGGNPRGRLGKANQLIEVATRTVEQGVSV